MSSALPDAVTEALLETPNGARVLLLGDAAHALAPALTTDRPDLTPVCEPLGSVPEAGKANERYDLGILCDLQAWGDRATAEQHIAALRDLLCKRVLVGATPGGTVDFSRADSLALGLKAAPTEYGKSVARNWYKYSIIHYKRAPDWLNSDNWAHPERWNSERW